MKTGIIGMGGMGSLYLDTFSKIDGADVIAIASENYSAIEAEKKGLRLFKSYEEMLNEAGLDVCCVCTPTFLHFQQIKAALSMGIHTIAEKPLVFTAQEAKELYETGKANGAMLFTAQVVRFASSTIKIKEIIDSNKYGRVQDARFFRLSKTPIWCKDSWIFDPKKSGLVTYDMHIHDLDLIIYLFGKPIAATMFDVPTDLPLDIDFRHYKYSFKGFDAYAEAAWYKAQIPFKAGFRVVFENAVAECENDSMHVYTKDGEHLTFSPHTESASDTGINVPKTDMYFLELSHFIDCIDKKTPSEIVKQEEIIMLLETLESICPN